LNISLELKFADGLALERELVTRIATPEVMRAARERAAAERATYARIFAQSKPT
jgi:hypothetical protein